MKVLRYCTLIFLLIIITFKVQAGKDPIGWTQAGNLPATTKVGETYTVVYHFKSNLPFVMLTPLFIGKQPSSDEFTFIDKCSKLRLMPNQTCDVTVNFKPKSKGAKSIRLLIEYGKNVVPLPILTTNSIGGNIPTVITIKGNGYPDSINIQLGAKVNPVTFTFQNTSDFVVKATNNPIVSGPSFTQSTNNCSLPIAPNGLCTITGVFFPNATGSSSLTATYDYSDSKGNHSVSVTIPTTVTPAGTGCSSLLPLKPLPLPVKTYPYSDNIVKFGFYNTCATATLTLQNVSITGTISGSTVGPNTITQGTGPLDNCSTKPVTPGATCFIYASVIPQVTPSGPVPLSVTASVAFSSSDGPSSTATTTTNSSLVPIPNVTTIHNVIFENQCPYNVWYGISNGIGGDTPDPTPPPNAPSQYFLPAQVPGQPSSQIVLPVQQYQNGSMWPRIGCGFVGQQFICQSGSCTTNPGTAQCVNTNQCPPAPTGCMQQPINPYTKFESNMLPTAGQDAVYDVSLINGMNAPVEVKGLGPLTSSDLFTNSCAGAGALIQPPNYAGLGSCPWSFNPPNNVTYDPASTPDLSSYYTFVSYPASGPKNTQGQYTGCTPATVCPAGEICGETLEQVDTTNTGIYTLISGCGKFLGYWTAADFISAITYNSPPNLFTQFNMSAQLDTFPPGAADPLPTPTYGTSVVGGPATYSDLFGCRYNKNGNGSLNSGYYTAPYNRPNICGCYNWDQSGSPAQTAQAQPCSPDVPGVSTEPNQQWINAVWNRIVWLKTACPTAYSYQFDDPSVSFQCNPPSGFTSYQVTFCPGGKTGAPGT